MRKTYFRHGPLMVSSDFVKARNRSIQLSTLESVEISRKLFFSALALCGGLIGFALVFGDLLHLHEMVLMVGIGAAALAAAWQIGTLTIYSKLTGAKGWAVTGRIGALQAMRTAVEEAIEDRDTRQAARRKRGGGVSDDDEGEDDDEAA